MINEVSVYMRKQSSVKESSCKHKFPKILILMFSFSKPKLYTLSRGCRLRQRNLMVNLAYWRMHMWI